MKKLKVYSITVSIWFPCIAIYTWSYVTSMMNYLKVNPSSDLYANNEGFQFMAFVLTRGFPALVLLLGILFIEKLILEKNIPPRARRARRTRRTRRTRSEI